MAQLKSVARPAQGNTSWYSHYTALDAAARALDEIVPIDHPDFTGANDNATFGNALSFMAAETRKRTLMFPSRTFGPLTTTRTPFDGLRMCGPLGNTGCKNVEISSGNLVGHKVTVTTGNGTSSLFNQSGVVKEVVLSDIAFQATNSTSQFWHMAAGSNMYPCLFHSLTFNSFMHAMGNPTAAFICTQGIFTGHWSVLDSYDTPLTFTGSDNLWDWFINLQSSRPSGAGRPQIIFDYVENSVVGYMYVTCEQDWGGVRIEGNVERDLRIYGGTFEGQAADNMATRPVVDLRGGYLLLDGADFGNVSDDNTTNAPGVIKQSGGRLVLRDATYNRPASTLATFPLLYQTAGTAAVERPYSCETGEQIRIRWSTAVTDTIALPSNVATA